VARVECARILVRRTGPPPVAFAAVNVPSGLAAGILELAGLCNEIDSCKEIA
jgi:hypothetical protein